VRVRSRTIKPGGSWSASLLPDGAGLVQIGQLELHAGSAVQPVQLGGVVQVDQRQAGGVLETPGLKRAGNSVPVLPAPGQAKCIKAA